LAEQSSKTRREVAVGTLLKLRLTGDAKDFDAVKALPGLAGLNLDPKFGLVLLDPQQSLYAVRADSVDDLAKRRQLSPEILEGYGDIRISTG